MSNTQDPRFCKIDGCDEVAYYVIGTSPDHGPQASFSYKMGRGRYCLPHAKVAAAAKMAAWQERRQAKLDANHASFVAWKANYDATVAANRSN